MSGPDGHEWSAARFDEETVGLAGVLARRGHGRRSRIVIALEPTAPAVVTFVSILRAGACVVPADPDATAGQAREIASASGADLVICESEDDERWGGLPTMTPADLRERWRAAGEPVDQAIVDQAAADDLGLIAFTSGTTGTRKAVPMTTGQLLVGTQALVDAWQWAPADVLLSALPLFHVHGLIVAVAASFTAGGRLVLEHPFDPQRVIADCLAHEVTMVFGVPTMWWRLDRTGVLDQLRGLRLAVSGSAPLAPELFDRVALALRAPPVERYGMTETLIIASNPVGGPRKAGSVGLPLPGVALRLSADGVVEVAGPTVMNGYLNRPPGEGFTPDGWFRTGDIGTIDDDGYLFLRGRASDLIITGGHNVHPAEVEPILASVPGVAEVAVAGLPDERWGEVVAAFVVLDPQLATDPQSPERVIADLRDAADEHLAPSQRPRVWETVARLPRNAMGKIERGVLVDEHVANGRTEATDGAPRE